MNKEGLKQEAEEYADKTRIKDENTYIGFPDERITEVQDYEGNRLDITERIVKTYMDSAEPREKRIAELETQIEKMKCCGNCRWEYPCSFCDDCKRLEGQIFAETLTSDNWEMK